MHFVWVGDDSLRPHNCIETWKIFHADWDVRIWGNDDWKNGHWKTKRHMDAIAETGQLCGVADLMRWEILLREGGVTLDADSVCFQSIPEWLLDCEAFAASESELQKPGLLANGYVGARAGNELIKYLVDQLNADENLATKFVWYKLKRKKRSSWKTTGPMALTNAVKALRYHNLTVVPSHFFIPRHYSGACYTGGGMVVCDQLYAGTGSPKYLSLLKLSPEELINEFRIKEWR